MTTSDTAECPGCGRERPKVIVELGIFGGRSLLPQALQLRDNGDGGIIYGIDPWTKAAALDRTADTPDSIETNQSSRSPPRLARKYQ